MKSWKKGLTLLEIIISATIVMILASIAFISVQNYYAQGRNAVRIADIHTFESWLEIFVTETWSYPVASDSETLNNQETWVVAYVWTTASSVSSIIKLSKEIKDPATLAWYIYSVDWNKTQYELVYSIESEQASLLNSANAVSFDRVIVGWNFNWVYAVSENGYIISMPSLIVEPGEYDFQSPKKLIFSVNWTSDFFAFSPTIIAEKEPETLYEEMLLIEKLKSAYQDSPAVSEEEVSDVLNTETSDEDAVKDLIEDVLDFDKVEENIDSIDWDLILPVKVYSSTPLVTVVCPSIVWYEYFLKERNSWDVESWKNCPKSKHIEVSVNVWSAEWTKEVVLFLKNKKSWFVSEISKYSDYAEWGQYHCESLYQWDSQHRYWDPDRKTCSVTFIDNNYSNKGGNIEWRTKDLELCPAWREIEIFAVGHKKCIDDNSAEKVAVWINDFSNILGYEDDTSFGCDMNWQCNSVDSWDDYMSVNCADDDPNCPWDNGGYNRYYFAKKNYSMIINDNRLNYNYWVSYCNWNKVKKVWAPHWGFAADFSASNEQDGYMYGLIFKCIN